MHLIAWRFQNKSEWQSPEPPSGQTLVTPHSCNDFQQSRVGRPSGVYYTWWIQVWGSLWRPRASCFNPLLWSVETGLNLLVIKCLYRKISERKKPPSLRYAKTQMNRNKNLECRKHFGFCILWIIRFYLFKRRGTYFTHWLGFCLRYSFQVVVFSHSALSVMSLILL